MSDETGWKDLKTGEYLSERDMDIRFQNSLNEEFGDVSIAGIEYRTAYALKEVSTTDYDTTFANWTDAEETAGMFRPWTDADDNEDEEDEGDSL